MAEPTFVDRPLITAPLLFGERPVAGSIIVIIRDEGGIVRVERREPTARELALEIGKDLKDIATAFRGGKDAVAQDIEKETLVVAGTQYEVRSSERLTEAEKRQYLTILDQHRPYEAQGISNVFVSGEFDRTHPADFAGGVPEPPATVVEGFFDP